MSRYSILDQVFIVKEMDEEGKYSLSEAKTLCAELGNGWRVPKIQELETIYNDSLELGISTLTRDLKLQTGKTYYLTDSLDEYDGWPLSFSFDDGNSYISSEKSKHSLRLVRSEINSSTEKKMSKEDFILKTILVLRKYVPDLKDEKFTQFMTECIDGDPELEEIFGKKEPINFENIRYVTLEDYNMCCDPNGFYVAHFHEDNDVLYIWEDDFYACGYNPDELDDEEEGLREGYIGFIDLAKQKYLRINGYGDEIEFGSDNPADEHPNWQGWC